MNDKDRFILKQNTEISRLRLLIETLLQIDADTTEAKRTFVKDAYKVIVNGKDGK